MSPDFLPSGRDVLPNQGVSSDPGAPANQGTEAWSDKLTIETPEQTVFDFPLAGVGSRALAVIIDTLIQFVAIILLVIVLSYTQAANRLAGINFGIWAEAIAIFIAFCIYYGYFAFFEAFWNGQTPGKRWTHLRVIHESGRPIAVPQAIARNLIRFIDQLPGMYAVGLVSALISRQNRRLGDYVAGTVVVHERPLEKGAATWAAAGTTGSRFGTPLAMNAAGTRPGGAGFGQTGAIGAEPAAPLVRWGATQLDGEDVRILNGFLERRYSLDVSARDRLARQIAERLSGRLGITFEQRRAAGQARYEDFLEAMARERQR